MYWCIVNKTLERVIYCTINIFFFFFYIALEETGVLWDKMKDDASVNNFSSGPVIHTG